MTEIVRARVAHTPRDPLVSPGALEAFEDGALALAEGRMVACGPYRDVHDGYPEAEVLDARDTILLPGFVDCHVHHPQIGSTRPGVLERTESFTDALGAVFTPAREEAIAEMRVAGRVV